MGKKNKLRKFAEILDYKNVVENYDFKDPKLIRGIGEEVELNGRWNEVMFQNNNELVLELACGRGEYTNALAKAYTNKNFIGVDIKGARIWKGAKESIDKGLKNVAFLRTRIEQIHLFFGENEVSEIWITFPDPFLMKDRNRLTHHRFLDLYSMILSECGIIHLKTDDTTLFEFSLSSLESWGKGKIVYHNDDIYSGELYSDDLKYKTYYENQHLKEGKRIKYVKFKYQKT